MAAKTGRSRSNRPRPQLMSVVIVGSGDVTVLGRVGRAPAVALWVDPKVHAAEIARFRSKIVAGPGDRDCSIWIGSIGADGYGQSSSLPVRAWDSACGPTGMRRRWPSDLLWVRTCLAGPREVVDESRSSVSAAGSVPDVDSGGAAGV